LTFHTLFFNISQFFSGKNMFASLLKGFDVQMVSVFSE